MPTTMNRLTAILLLSLFAFHQLGYYFFYAATKYKINQEWEEKIEKQLLKEQDMNYMALPISYPYQQDQAMYQPTNESLEFGDEFYRVIKKRYANDTLHIIYVDDVRSEHLKQSFKDWVNTIYQEKNPESQRQIMLSGFDKNYFKNEVLIAFSAPEPAKIQFKDHYALNYYYQYSATLEHPPKPCISII